MDMFDRSHWIAFLALALVVACGDDAAGGTCPSELRSSANWRYSGSDDRCAELASALNDSGSIAGDDSGACGVQISTRSDGACKATITSSCDDAELRAECAVKPDGAATCKAKLTAAGLSCDLTLELR